MNEPASSVLPSAPLAAAPEKPAAKDPKANLWYVDAWDMLIGLMVLALAFLLVSFAVRNSDFWQHLAAGRLLAGGAYSFGVDPFGYGQPDKYWVNHAWLFDWGLYEVHTRLGDGLLVLMKALFIAGLALSVILMKRQGESYWLTAICGGLAVLASGSRLQVQPFICSVGGVALTSYILLRIDPKRWVFILPPLFLAWANLDAWFFLGPTMLALVFLGDLYKGGSRQSGLALIAGVLACTINPHHFHVWQLPAELTSDALRDFLTSNEFRSRSGSNFGGIFEGKMLSLDTQDGMAPTAAAIIALTILTVLALALNLRRVHPGHALIVLLLAAIVIRYGRAIPLFAFASASIAAYYLGTTIRRLSAANIPAHIERAIQTARLGGRLITTVALSGLLFACWPGWLHPNWDIPEYALRVAWSVEPDAGLERAATTLKEWRDSGKLPADARCFTFAPDFANYCAWFAPGEKQFFDTRFTYNEELIEEFAAARYLMVPSPTREGQAPPLPNFDLKGFFTKRGIAFLAWGSFSRQENLRTLSGLLRVPFPKTLDGAPAWEFWDSQGRVSFLGWREAPTLTPNQRAELKFDPVRQAFAQDRVPMPKGEPVLPPAPLPFWAEYLRGTQKHASYADEAANLVEYQMYQYEYAERILLLDKLLTSMTTSGLIGNWMKVSNQQLLPRTTNAMRGTALLAVRAARRAIAENPDSPDGYYYLGRAYAPNEAAYNTVEELRAAVVAAGYHRALARTSLPEQERRRTLNIYGAYERLFALHSNKREYDLAYEAYEGMLKTFWYFPPPNPNLRTKEDFENAYKYLEQKVGFPGNGGKLIHPTELIQELRSRYDNIYAKKNDPIERAMLAVISQQGYPYFGLVSEALNELKNVDFDKVEPEDKKIQGLLLYVELSLRAGKVEEAYQLLGLLQGESALQKNFGYQASFNQLFVRAKFLMGELDSAADAQRNLLEETVRMQGRQLMSLPIMPLQNWEIFFQLTNQPFNSWPLLLRGIFLNQVREQQQLLEGEAEILAQIGLIYLEDGNNAEAKKFFERSLKPRDDVAVNFPARGIVLGYLDAFKEAAKKK